VAETIEPMVAQIDQTATAEELVAQTAKLVCNWSGLQVGSLDRVSIR
jgi:hypothetical protein